MKNQFNQLGCPLAFYIEKAIDKSTTPPSINMKLQSKQIPRGLEVKFEETFKDNFMSITEQDIDDFVEKNKNLIDETNPENLKLPKDYTPEERKEMFMYNMAHNVSANVASTHDLNSLTGLSIKNTEADSLEYAAELANKYDFENQYVTSLPSFIDNTNEPNQAKTTIVEIDEFINLIKNDVENDYYLFTISKHGTDTLIRFAKSTRN